MNTSGAGSRWGRAASVWCLLFGSVHVYWACGGRVGLPSDLRLSDHPYLLAADLVAIPLCFGFAGLASGLRCSRRSLKRLVVGGAGVVCLAHALPPLASEAWRVLMLSQPIVQTERHHLAIFVYEPFWLLGGVLLLTAAFADGRGSCTAKLPSVGP